MYLIFSNGRGRHMSKEIEQLSINTIRTLAIDAIEKANSVHPGLPMGAAPMVYTLLSYFMIHDPIYSSWFYLFLFVLSVCQCSMILYCLLHLSRYDVITDHLKEFR